MRIAMAAMFLWSALIVGPAHAAPEGTITREKKLKNVVMGLRALGRQTRRRASRRTC